MFPVDNYYSTLLINVDLNVNSFIRKEYFVQSYIGFACFSSLLDFILCVICPWSSVDFLDGILENRRYNF